MGKCSLNPIVLVQLRLFFPVKRSLVLSSLGVINFMFLPGIHLAIELRKRERDFIVLKGTFNHAPTFSSTFNLPSIKYLILSFPEPLGCRCAYVCMCACMYKGGLFSLSYKSYDF